MYLQLQERERESDEKRIMRRMRGEVEDGEGLKVKLKKVVVGTECLVAKDDWNVL